MFREPLVSAANKRMDIHNNLMTGRAFGSMVDWEVHVDATWWYGQRFNVPFISITKDYVLRGSNCGVKSPA